MSSKSKFKKVAKPKSLATKEPRTVNEINQEYSQLASQIGAATVQIRGIQFGIDQMLDQVSALGAEMNAREQLDKAKADQPKVEAKETAQVAPVATQGVVNV